MRILYDDEIFFRQRFGGVSRIFAELIEQSRNRHQDKLLFRCGYSENEYLLSLYPDTHSFFKSVNFPFKGKLIRALYGNYSHTRTNKLLRQNKTDIFHPTFYADYYLDSLVKSDARLVFTIHDLIHEKQPDNAHYRAIAQVKEKNLRLAEQVIVVSEHTKKDLLTVYPFVDEKLVHVIPLAQSLPVKGIMPSGLPARYILFTGERSGYKNFVTLLECFAEIHKTYGNLHLFCAGGREFTSSERELIRSYNISAYVKQAQLLDVELTYAYQNAEMFVFPSLYEGFGIPVLEAFAAGAPVVLSDKTSLPEVGGDAALYADCSDPEQLKQAIVTILEDENLKKQLIARGHERESEFSWKQHVEATRSVYQKALQ